MKTAKVFHTGAGQTVELPDGFHFNSDTVSIRREGDAVILEPVKPVSWPEAFFEAMVDLETIQERTERSIEIRAGALDDLMLNWLDEFLYLYETDALLFKRFQIQSIKENHIQARASGEILDPARHEIRAGIKAVTYHQLYVEERNGLWEAQVILDI